MSMIFSQSSCAHFSPSFEHQMINCIRSWKFMRRRRRQKLQQWRAETIARAEETVCGELGGRLVERESLELSLALR